MNVRGKKIFVGLSGGVDSAVTAALVQKAGAEVTGVFIKGWYPPELPCTWREDRRDAMRVAAHLSIPFVTLDASAEYKKGVIDYLIREYREGRTPNPDIMCNREVKFGAFFDFAMSHGADSIATGHYARSENGKLLRGVDPSKDQSYFLWNIPSHTLAKTIFPVGGIKKEQVRVLAKKFKLPVAEKKDSQGICFLGAVSVEDFLRAELGSVPGTAVDETGKEVGTHNGVLLYTLGERVSLPNGPWYVREKHIKENMLAVSNTRLTADRETHSLRIADTNFFSEPPTGELTAEYRYHGEKISGRFDSGQNIFIPLTPLNETPASGQSLVLYHNDEVLGGGILI